MADLAAPVARAVRHRRSQRYLVGTPDQHLRAQARGAAALRPDGRGHRGHDGPEGLEPELAHAVRLLPSHLDADDDEIWRARARRERYRTGGAEARSRSLAQADLRGLRVRARLPRSAGPLLRALRPGTDQARDREATAGRVLAVPRRESRPLPFRRKGRRTEGLRAGLEIG